MNGTRQNKTFSSNDFRQLTVEWDSRGNDLKKSHFCWMARLVALTHKNKKPIDENTLFDLGQGFKFFCIRILFVLISLILNVYLRNLIFGEGLKKLHFWYRFSLNFFN